MHSLSKLHVRYTRRISQETRSRQDTPGCCPLLTGVLYHSVGATRALLQILLADGDGDGGGVTVVLTPEGSEMSGRAYAQRAMEALFSCMASTSVLPPTFGCGNAFGWFNRANPGFFPVRERAGVAL